MLAEVPNSKQPFLGDFTTPSGVSLHYEIRGAGEPLVIINNFFMLASHWRNFTKRMERRFRIINYDLRNQGASTKVSEPVDFKDHVDDLTALMDHLGLESAHLMGVCVSSLIARDFALRAPSRVRSLTMVGPTLSPFGGAHRRFMMRSLTASLRAGGAEGLFDHYYPLLYTPRTLQSNRVSGYLAIKMSFLEANPVDQLLKHFESSHTADDDPALLRELTAPTLLLAGEDDALTSSHAMRLLVGLIPNAICEFIVMAGHNPYFEATSAFEELVMAFLVQHTSPLSLS